MKTRSDSLSETPASLAAWLETQRTAKTRRDIVSRFSRYALDRNLACGSIVRLLPDAYVAATWASTFSARASSALLWAGPGCALGGPSAAHVHGVVNGAPERIDLCAPPSANLRGPDWIRVLQPGGCGAASIVRGLACVPLTDALIQMWLVEGTGAGTSAILAAVRNKHTTGAALSARAAAYPRVPSRRALMRLLDALAGGVESYLEHLAMTRVFTTRDFAGFTRQHRVRVSGRHYVVDMWHEGAKVAVELDGRIFHSDDEARRRDLERDTDLASVGIITVRFTFEDITGRPEWCRTRLKAVLTSRSRRAT